MGASATKPLLKVSTVARNYGVCEESVRRWIRAGRLEAVRLGPRGSLRVPADALNKFERPAR